MCWNILETNKETILGDSVLLREAVIAERIVVLYMSLITDGRK